MTEEYSTRPDGQRLVESIARHFEGQGVELSELIRAGNEGLAKAEEKFSDREDSFANWAGWWIRQAISIYIAKQNGKSRPEG